MTSNSNQTPVPEVIPCQLSLRAYFVAHAPEVPGWFKPVMPEPKWPKDFHPGSDLFELTKKAVSEGWSLKHAEDVTGAWLADDRNHLLRYLEQHLAAKRQQEQNDRTHNQERFFQWPLHWADSMIERLGH